MPRRRTLSINAVAVRSDGLVTTFIAPTWRSFAEQAIDVADSAWAENRHGPGTKKLRVSRLLASDGGELRTFHLTLIRAWLMRSDAEDASLIEEAT